MKTLFVLSCFIIFSSCDDSENYQSSEPTIETANSVPMLSSFDFIKNIKSDNFYSHDINGKKISVSNLIVNGYSIDGDGNAKIICMAYSPEKSKIYLANRYSSVYGRLYDGTNLFFQVGNKNLEWLKDGNYDGMANRPFPMCYDFIIALSNPKDIENLSFYNGSISENNFAPLKYNNRYYRFMDVVSIEGNFDYSEGSFLFKNSVFKKDNNINYSDTVSNVEYENNLEKSRIEDSTQRSMKTLAYFKEKLKENIEKQIPQKYRTDSLDEACFQYAMSNSKLKFERNGGADDRDFCFDCVWSFYKPIIEKISGIKQNY